jgi:hypothetical protein
VATARAMAMEKAKESAKTEAAATKEQWQRRKE